MSESLASATAYTRECERSHSRTSVECSRVLDPSLACYSRVLDHSLACVTCDCSSARSRVTCECWKLESSAHWPRPSARRGKLICTSLAGPARTCDHRSHSLFCSGPPSLRAFCFTAHGSVLSSPSLRALSPSRPRAIFSESHALILRAGPALSSPSPMLSALVIRTSYSRCTREL